MLYNSLADATLSLLVTAAIHANSRLFALHTFHVLLSHPRKTIHLCLVMQSQNPACKVTESEVINAPEPGTKSVSFLTCHSLRGPDMPDLPLAEVGLVRAAAPPAAVPALQPPSQACLCTLQLKHHLI